MDTTVKTTMLDAALEYAKLGWLVFPLQEYGKTPRISVKDGGKGCYDGTKDVKQINTWWSRWPNCNIGIHCQQFFVLDVDTKNNGPSALEGLIRTYGELPNTLRQTSGAGGKHYLFTSPVGIFIKNRSGFYPGLDTRSFGGYIVASPSIHPDTGETYQWENWGTKIAEAPQWLIELVKDKREAFKAPERSDTGHRDVDDAALAGYLFNGGMNEQEVFDVLQRRNNDPNRRDVPLPTNEVWKTVRSIGKRDIRTPSSLRQALHEQALTIRTERPDVKPDELWEERMVRNKAMLPKNILANTELALGQSPLFCNALVYDEFNADVRLTRNIVDPISKKTIGGLTAGKVVDENIIREITSVAQRLITAVTFTEETIASGVQLVARGNAYHPVQDYLHALQWDETKRIDTWLIDHMGVEDDSEGYARAVGRRWLIAAVARALKPGCKSDSALIIEGPQGCGKSSALKVLAGKEWFKDSVIDFKSKDRFSALKGVWIYEMAEFDQYKNHDAATIKSYLSSESDSYRVAYGRSDIRQPRGVIFVGTTNKGKSTPYLGDSTGNRRFWPVEVVNHTIRKPINRERLESQRDQIWAEAVRAYYNGEPGFLDAPELIAAHEKQAHEREDTEDTWVEFIIPYLHANKGKRISTGDLMTNALMLKTTEHTKQNQSRVKRLMENLGFKYTVARVDGYSGTVKTWVRSSGQQKLL